MEKKDFIYGSQERAVVSYKSRVETALCSKPFLDQDGVHADLCVLVNTEGYDQIMDETFQYPVEDLQTISTTQAKNLSDAWAAHQTHLNQYILQPASQLGSHGDTFQQHMTTWSTNLGKLYRACSAYTNLLNAGATKMEDLDNNVGQSF